MLSVPSDPDLAIDADTLRRGLQKRCDAQWTRPSSQSTSTNESQFLQLVGILRRRFSMILAISLLGTAVAIAAALLVAPKFTATALLVVDPIGEAKGEQSYNSTAIDEALDTHLTLISSRENLRQVIEDLSQSQPPRSPASSELSVSGATGSASAAAAPGSVRTQVDGHSTIFEMLKERFKFWLKRAEQNGATPSISQRI